MRRCRGPRQTRPDGTGRRKRTPAQRCVVETPVASTPDELAAASPASMAREPLAQIANTAATHIARMRLLIRASSNRNAHTRVRRRSLAPVLPFWVPTQGICRHSPVRGMFASRIGPPTNAAYFGSVLTRGKSVKSKGLKYASHRTALWMTERRRFDPAHTAAAQHGLSCQVSRQGRHAHDPFDAHEHCERCTPERTRAP